MAGKTAPQGRTYLDGPASDHLAVFRHCYANDPAIDTVEAAAELATAIDYWLCGPSDDGDESQEFILARAVERAARFIAAQPCLCDMSDGDLCDRCRAVGCGFGEHRMDCGDGAR